MKRKNEKTKFVEIFIWSPLLLIVLLTPSGLDFIMKTIFCAVVLFTIIVCYTLLKRKNKQNEFAKVEKEYLKDPDNLNKYIELGYSAFNARDHDRAYSIFNKILSQYPERPAGYCGLGIIEFDKKKFKQAKAYFERTIELDSSYDIAKQKLEYIMQNELA